MQGVNVTSITQAKCILRAITGNLGVTGGEPFMDHPYHLNWIDNLKWDQLLDHSERTRDNLSAEEHPVALQLGGSNPDWMAQAAAQGAAYGYDEININVGCPSDRVQSGQFGACLMAHHEVVADCLRAMCLESIRK